MYFHEEHSGPILYIQVMRKEGVDQNVPRNEEYLRTHTIGELEPLDAPVVLVDYDPEWPDTFRQEAEKIRSAVGKRALRVEHVGSTSVPNLTAKPIIDIVLVVSVPPTKRITLGHWRKRVINSVFANLTGMSTGCSRGLRAA